jgi:hypothetical protein
MSCGFLPPIPIYIGYAAAHRRGGIAVNVDGTRFASVHCDAHCVYIYDAPGCPSDPIVVGTPHTFGSAHGELDNPAFVCFVHRDGVDTLLIADSCNYRVVEVTAGGEFMRAIVMDGLPWGIAERDGVIAVSLCWTHAVVLLQYETGAVKPEVTIGTGTTGNADGQLHYPRGVRFTTDSRYILVADYANDRVSKFSAASGAFVAHVISNGITRPRDVLQCEDGSIVVAHVDGVTRVGKVGVTVEEFSVSSSVPSSLSPSLNDVVVKCEDGSAFVLRDAWFRSLRCTWVHACVTK